MSAELTLVTDEIGMTGLTAKFDDDVDFASWARLGRNLSFSANAMNFYLGDWINFGLQKFCREREGGKFAPTDAYKAALAATGLEHDTLRNLAWVAGTVAPGARSDKLSWAHHREVAALKPTKQRHWLRLAEQGTNGEGWSVSELRVAIREAGKMLDDPNEPPVPGMKWAKPAEDLYRFLKQVDNEEPVEEMAEDKRQALRLGLKDLKAFLDRLWATPG